jgi:Arc/MetJ-type ribon-helix-helix transcriptional regulator
MPLITVKVTEDIRRKMKELRHINWSEVIRHAIEERIKMEGERRLVKAILLNERYVIIPDEGFSSTELIRSWREGIRWRGQ